jgi:hypothetical protein
MYIVTGEGWASASPCDNGGVGKKVPDQEARRRKSADGLRHVARVLLDRADKVDSPEKRRKLLRQAFELLQEAIALAVSKRK